MARTDTDRFNGAMGYLHTYFPSIEGQILKISHLKAEEIGKEISLKGAFYFLGQSDSKKMAVRALLLCQKVLMPVGFKLDLSKTRKHYRSKGEDSVRDAIRCYKTLSHAEIANVAAAAERPSSNAQWDWTTVTRQTPNWSGTCYSAVLHWSFQAGFVTLPALARGVPQGLSPNGVLGRGMEIQGHQNWASEFQRGEIFNFHVSGLEIQNHWGVALGGGMAAAVNNGQVRNDALRTGGNLQVLAVKPDHTTFSLAACADVTRGPKLYKLENTTKHLVIRRISPADSEGTAFES